jgi:hypothetical protein
MTDEQRQQIDEDPSDRAAYDRSLFPHYHLVPKEFRANLAFRRKVLLRAKEDVEFRAAIRKMCAEDCLFFISAFCWTYDTRGSKHGSAVRPFIPWPYQEEAVAEIINAIGDHDLMSHKSRDMGASWIFILVPAWRWQFYPNQDILFVSRNEEYVDQPENKKAMFWKLDFIHKYQPRWLLPTGRWKGRDDPNRTSGHVHNQDNNSTIDGEATTGELASGDRRIAIVLDEFSKFKVKAGYQALTATRDATPCRLFNFTPKGIGNAAYDLTKTAIRRLELHWSRHPLKRRGLYERLPNGNLRIRDRAYWERKLAKAGVERTDNLEADCLKHKIYPFVLDDIELSLRSPWFDNECRRARSRAEIFQELEIRYDASSSPFFNVNQLREHRKLCSPPLAQGMLDWVEESLRPTAFVPQKGGYLQLWINLLPNGRPDDSKDYVIGCDIAAGGKKDGRGSSNSVAVIAERERKTVVGIWVVHGVAPETFADQVTLLVRFFQGINGDAKLIWEDNGPGGAFRDRIIDNGCRRLYYRKQRTVISGKVTDQPGWWSSPKTKPSLFSEFRRAIGPDSEFILNCAEILDECEHFVHLPSGGVEHAEAVGAEDPSGARDNHGDRATAAAVCWEELHGKREKKPDQESAPVGSLAWRREQRRARKREGAYDWT